MKSYAYLDDTNGWDSDKNIQIIDFISSKFPSSQIIDFSKLQIFRAARCEECKNLKFINLPELQAIDISISGVKELLIENCPKLKAIDASFCQDLSKIEGTFPSLEYLSVSASPLSSFPKTPQLKFLCAEWMSIDPPIFSYPKLEACFIHNTVSENSYTLSQISKCKSLILFSIKNAKINLNSLSWFSHLLYLDLSKCTITGNIDSFPNLYIIDQDGVSHGQLKEANFTYLDSARILYGPYPIPHCDISPLPLSSSTSTPQQSISSDEQAIQNEGAIPIYSFPGNSSEAKRASEKICGSIFGCAVMDMIGLGVEFLMKPVSSMLLARPLDITWTHPRVSMHTGSFVRGTSTDDTSQAVLIMRSIVAHPEIELKDFAARLIEWMKKGHEEHKHGGGLGLGKTVKRVITDPNYVLDPISVAKSVYMDSNAQSNGAVMRTAPTGCFCFWDEATVIRNAKSFCRATHYAPTCVFSTVCVSLLISRYLQNDSFGSIEDIDKTIQDSIKETEDLDETMLSEIEKYTSVKNVEELELGINHNIGYTLKTCGAGIWAAKYADSYIDGLVKVIREGGDSDTNGAVVGSILGAKIGFSKLPIDLIRYMFDGPWLYREITLFLRTMNLDPPPFPNFVWKVSQ